MSSSNLRSELIVILTIGLLMGAIYIIPASDVEAAQVGDFIYSTSGGKVTITEYVGQGGAVSIPSTIGGMSVVALAKEAFSSCDNVTSVVIPDSVTSMGDNCFSGCTSLQSVVMGAGVTVISRYAFSDCTALTSVTIGSSVTGIGYAAFRSCEALTSLDIPDSVTSIQLMVFDDCTSLGSITVGPGNTVFASVDGVLYDKGITKLIRCPYAKVGDFVVPNTVTNIEGSALSDCNRLTSIAVQNSVVNIGAGAFMGCREVTTISLGGGVASIGDSAFDDCPSLTAIYVGGSNGFFDSIDGVLYNLDASELIRFPGAKGGAFTIPDTVTSLADYSFKDCDNLTALTMSSSVTEIGNYAFFDCDNLTFVTLSDNLAIVGAASFKQCGSLITITIPATVTELKSEAFLGCTSLVSINVDVANAAYADLDGVLYNKDYSHLISFPGAKGGAFTTPETVTLIEYRAFSDNTALTSIVLGSKVQEIGNMAIYNCQSLSSVAISASVEKLGSNMFEKCGVLTAINVASGNTVFASVDGVLYDESLTTLLRYPGGKTGAFITPDGVTTIAKDSFSISLGLSELTISDDVTSIGSSAFSDCTSLRTVTIGEGLLVIPSMAFWNCVNLTTIEMGKNVTTIRSNAFTQCTSLQAVSLPATTSLVERKVFSQCNNLTSITFLGMSVPTIENENWVEETAGTLRGHAFESSDFPSPGEEFLGLLMGSVIQIIPDAPLGLIGAHDDGNVELTWSAPSYAGVSDITDYLVYRSDGSNGTYALIGSPSGLNYTDTNVTEGRTYWYKVSAVNLEGEGASSDSISVEVPESTSSNTWTYLIVAVAVVAALSAAAILILRRRK